MPYEFIIDDEYEGISPKNFLKKKLDEPYSKLYKYMKEKRITLNGKKIKSDMKLKKGDVVKVWLDSIKKLEPKPEINKYKQSKDLGMKTIFENNDFLVLNKLPGVIVQGASDNETSLSYHLEHLRKKNKDKTGLYFHVHRLDKETSGVLVCSKNVISRRELNEVFRKKDLQKTYICLCIGKFKTKKGKVEVNLDRTPQEIKEKVIVSKSGKYSLSEYKVISEHKFKGEILSLVEVQIKTGVTHQIRVHMKHLGHPIICDKMYGNSYVNDKFKSLLNRQFLHAKSLGFKYKNKTYKFEADLTNDLKKVMKILK